MADKNLNINILAKDKSRQALQGVQGNLNKTKQSVLNLKNALIGLGVGLALKSIVNVGSEVESLQVKFKFLFGSVEEGKVAFDNLAKFAGRVPFSLEAITRASGSLAVVSKDANDLNRILEITGNVAAISGLDFETAAMQIQRAFSSGVNSADLFRERGVTALLGFESGARVSIEETVKRFEEAFSGDGEFAKATDDLAQTFEGTLSMLGDKVFNFQKTIAQAGFFPELKRQFGNLNEFLDENSAKIDVLATKIGIGLARATVAVAKGFKTLFENADLVLGVLGGIIALKITSFFVAMTTALVGLTAQMTLFNVATKKNIIFGGIAAFVTGFTLLIAKFREFSASLGQFNTLDLAKDLETSVLVSKNLREEIKMLEEDLKKQGDIGARFDIQTSIKKKQKQLEELDKLIKRFANEEINTVINTEKAKEDIKKVLFNSQIINLQKSFMTEQELLRHNTDEQLKIIQDFLENEKNLTLAQKEELRTLEGQILSNFFNESLKLRADNEAKIDDFNALRVKKNKELAEELLRIEKEKHAKNLEIIKSGKLAELDLEGISNKQIKDLTTSAGREALERMSAHNKKAFALNKALKIADAVIDGVAGVQKALALGPLGIPLAILMGALTAANVATIAQQQYTGRRQGGMTPRGQPFLVGEEGPELFVPQQTGTIQNNDSLMGTNVNITINAVDTRGFRSLLRNERSTIVNLINEAVTDKGRPAVI